jgi:hypothetical protein
MKDRTQELNELCWEAKHNVDPTMGINVRPHCTDGSRGTYTLCVEVWEDNNILSCYFGQDAIDFLADYRARLEN